jgi:hypothetical protein
VDTAQLAAWFKANKTEALMVGGAAVAGLALYKRKTGAAGAPSGVTAGAVAPGTMPAAAVVPAGGGSYDSSAWSAYNALQDEIGTLARQNEAARQTGAAGSGASAAVKGPLASTLLAPSGSGRYVQNGNGTIAEVESDGSLYGMQLGEWLPFYNSGSRPGAYVDNSLTMYSIGQNLAARQAALTADKGTTGA